MITDPKNTRPPASAQRQATIKDKHPDLTWEAPIPLVTNPKILGAWFKAMGATYLLCMLIMSGVFIGTGEAKGLPLLAGWFALITLGLTVAGLLVMLLVFGNRFRARFTISERGITYQGIDRRAQTLARLAVLAGAVAGSARTAGAGLLAVSQERVALNWKGAFAARYEPHTRTITIRNQWRSLMHIYCTPENFTQVRDRVAQLLALHGTQERLANRPSPIPKALLHTLLILCACVPLFALNEIAGLDVLVTILIMCFALATLWLIPLFAWVVLLLEGYVLVHLGMALIEYREYTLISTYSYRKFEALDGSEWAMVLAGLGGVTYLAWISIRAARGRLVPVLFQDQELHGG